MIASHIYPAMWPLGSGICVVLPQHLWKILRCCLSRAAYLSSPCNCSFQSSSFLRKGITLLMNMQAEEGIKETRENHPARGLEEHAGSGGRGGKEKCVKQCCVSSITFHWSICGFVSALTSYNQDKSQTKSLGVNKSRREVCLSRFLIVWKLNICQRLEGLWPPHLGGRCFWSYDTGEWILKKYSVGKPEVLSAHCHCLFFLSGFLTS